MRAFDAARQILDRAVRDAAFPAAVVEVGGRAGPHWSYATGRLGLDPGAPATTRDTVFDLASLTKVIATTTLAMRQVDRGRLDLDQPLRALLPEWRGADRAAVTVGDLLAHASGLTAHLPFFRDHHGRIEFEHAICRLALEYTPRTKSVYSDLGFMLLGFVLADRHPGRAPLDRQFAELVAERGWGEVAFRPPPGWRTRTAPTEHDVWRGRLLVGEVHDENAWALGGVSGHAGLFGTAAAVGRFAREILAARDGTSRLVTGATLERFLTPTPIPGSSRALGWDTMRPTSSCGHRMSPEAVGHTGFTGTSLWLDPPADRYVVLLTNRVHPSRANDAILAVRPAVHDAVMTVDPDVAHRT